MAQHTPGPWTAFPADYQRKHDSDPLPIFVVGPQEFHTVCQVRAGCEDDDLPAQTEANARLIAAAPEMLRALTGAWHALKSYQYGNASTELAEEIAGFCAAAIVKATGKPAAFSAAAIAKATGESPP